MKTMEFVAITVAATVTVVVVVKIGVTENANAYVQLYIYNTYSSLFFLALWSRLVCVYMCAVLRMENSNARIQRKNKSQTETVL